MSALAPNDAFHKDERKLKKVCINLMRQKEFALFSGIMMCGTTGIEENLATAATDGYNIFFGRKFLRVLDEKMIGFVILHETLHKAFKHLSIYKRLFDEDHQLANKAADYVINLYIVQMDPTGKYVTFPVINGERIGLLDQRFAGMNTKQVFDILKQEKKNKKPQGGNKGGGAGDSGMPQGPGDAGDAEGGDNPNQADGGFDEHRWEEAKAVSPEQKAKQATELDRALRQGQALAAKHAGTGSANGHKELGELLDPQIDWKEQLREFVQATCAAKEVSSWRKVNRRLVGQELYMPSLIGESVREIVVCPDASGSTFFTPTTIPTFLSETAAAIEAVSPEITHLIYWDTLVTGVEVYDQSNRDDLANSTKITGGGGTDPSCVEKYLKKEGIRPECIIMLTDGFVPNWGDTWDGVPILWIIAGHHDKSIQASTGITVHIKDGEH